MSFLDGARVACFDLFDTLVRVDTSSLPALRFDGNEVRSTLPILHERLFARRGVAFEDLVSAVRALWREVRAELEAEDSSWPEISAVEKYRRLGRSLGIDAAEREAVAHEVADLHHATLVGAACALPGAPEVLARVRERGVPTALVSNWDHAAAAAPLLARTGLTGLLDHVVISEAVGVRKPDPRIFREALSPFGVEPEDALHVGDLARGDAWGAGRLGMRAVWINPAGSPWPESEHPPALVVAGVADLLALL